MAEPEISDPHELRADKFALVFTYGVITAETSLRNERPIIPKLAFVEMWDTVPQDMKDFYRKYSDQFMNEGFSMESTERAGFMMLMTAHEQQTKKQNAFMILWIAIIYSRTEYP